MSLIDHPLWREVLPYIRIEIYGRDGGPWHPRHRIEVSPLPIEIELRALSVVVPCVACGRPIHPIRARRAPAGRGNPRLHLYYAPCCRLRDRMGCSRGDAARQEYIRVRRAVALVDQAIEASRQPQLF